MNCWKDGTPLTTEDMVTLGLEHGALTAAQVAGWRGESHFGSKVRSATADLRHTLMFVNRVLTLRTVVWEAPPAPTGSSEVLDWFLAHGLVRTGLPA